MVVTCLRPTVATDVMHDLVGTPLRWTVQAPHLPTPQPYLVPGSSRLSRSTHNNGVSEATSTVRDWPLTLSVYFGMTRYGLEGQPGVGKQGTDVRSVGHKISVVNQR